MLKSIDSVNEYVGKATAWLTAFLTILICYNVAMRYMFSNSEAWRTELEWHIFALIFLLGAGYALKHDKHVRVDLFYANFSPKRKALVDLVGTIIFLIPWCLIIIFTSYEYAYNAWLIDEGSPDGGLPARYLIKFAITLGMFLLLLQAIALSIKSFQTLILRKTDDK